MSETEIYDSQTIKSDAGYVAKAANVPSCKNCAGNGGNWCITINIVIGGVHGWCCYWEPTLNWQQRNVDAYNAMTSRGML